MRQNKRWSLQLLNHISHGKRLTRARHPKQCLSLIAHTHRIHQGLDRLGLVALGFIIAADFKIHVFREAQETTVRKRKRSNTEFDCRQFD